MSSLHESLGRCIRCRTRHGQEEEPPIDWAPLADDEGLIHGIVCPGCREVIQVDPPPGLNVVEPRYAIPDSGIEGTASRVDTIKLLPPPTQGADPPNG